MTWTPPPPARFEVVGTYMGNAYPMDYEYEVSLVAESEDMWRISTATADGALIDSMTLRHEDAEQVREAASTALRWPIPGLMCEPSWRLALDSPTHYVVLNSDQLDAASAWLEFWQNGNWADGEEWMY